MQPDRSTIQKGRFETGASASVRHILRAGPLSLVYQDGEIRYLRLGSRELVRRIYVTVRDENWATILPSISQLHIQTQDGAFQISFEAQHRERKVDFSWKGCVSGDALGKVLFSINGIAQASFLQSRVGICVLHPIVELAGRPCVVRHTDGSRVRALFPYYISPHQPLKDILSIEYERKDNLQAIIEFAGGVFEMEDQRNWADGSYKTYSPPLAVPHPTELPALTTLQQSVSIELVPPQLSLQAPAAPSRTVLRIGSEVIGQVPRIGLAFAHEHSFLTEVQRERLKPMKLDHLRVDLHLSQPDYAALLERASQQAQAIEVPLLLGLTISDNAQLRELMPALARIAPRVAACLLFDAHQYVAGAELLAYARKEFRKYEKSVLLGTGSNGNFVELNRAQPLAAEVDFLCYPISPQIHRTDDDTLIESLEAHKWSVESAKRIAPGRPVFVTPVSLKPRSRENAVDPRQRTLFGAAWTLGSLKHLAEAGAARATYFETQGERGIQCADDDGIGAKTSHSSVVFPIYHVLADAGEFSGAEVLAAHSTEPLRVEILALRHKNRLRILCANYTDEPESVLIIGLPEPMRVARVRRLDGTSVVMASRSPNNFRNTATTEVIAPLGQLELDLSPVSVVCMDGEI